MMNPEVQERLMQSPYRSFWRERQMATEILRVPKESRTLEENLAVLVLQLTYGERTYDVGRSGSQPIENGWTEATMYRAKSKEEEERYEHNYFSPEGQCYPTNLNFAVLAERSEFKKDEQIKMVHVKGGKLYEDRDGELVLISDHHGWVKIDADDGKKWLFDLAAHQFVSLIDNPDGHIRAVMRGVDGHVTNPDISGVNWRMFRHNNDDVVVAPNAYPLHYVEDTELSAPLRELDWKRASGGRAELLMGAIGLGRRSWIGTTDNATIELTNKWWPKGFSHKKVADGAGLKTYPVTLPESSGADTEEAVELVKRSSRGAADLSIEGLGLLLKELMDECPEDVLVEWAIDSMDRVVDSIGYSGALKKEDSVPMRCVNEARRALRDGSGMSDKLRSDLKQVQARLRDSNFSGSFTHTIAVTAVWNAVDAVRAFTTNKEGIVGLRHHVQRAIYQGSEAVDLASLSRKRIAGPSERHWQYLDLYKRMKRAQAQEGSIPTAKQ